MKWVDFLKLCGVSRSQWDCIRNSKPMGQLVFERIADNLKIDYVWMMFGAVEDMAGYFQPIHDAEYPLPEDKKIQAVAEEIVSDALKAKPLHPDIVEESKAVKVLEMYEMKDNHRLATIGIKDGKYQYVYIEGIDKCKWSFDDVMFLGEVAQEIKRMVQG